MHTKNKDREFLLGQCLHVASSALTLISNGARSDGSYNYDRLGCKYLAEKALKEIKEILQEDIIKNEQ
jgi:hypothetical protein